MYHVWKSREEARSPAPPPTPAADAHATVYITVKVEKLQKNDFKFFDQLQSNINFFYSILNYLIALQNYLIIFRIKQLKTFFIKHRSTHLYESTTSGRIELLTFRVRFLSRFTTTALLQFSFS